MKLIRAIHHHPGDSHISISHSSLFLSQLQYLLSCPTEKEFTSSLPTQTICQSTSLQTWLLPKPESKHPPWLSPICHWPSLFSLLSFLNSVHPPHPPSQHLWTNCHLSPASWYQPPDLTCVPSSSLAQSISGLHNSQREFSKVQKQRLLLCPKSLGALLCPEAKVQMPWQLYKPPEM